jgi:hypothetical protein
VVTGGRRLLGAGARVTRSKRPDRAEPWIPMPAAGPQHWFLLSELEVFALREGIVLDRTRLQAADLCRYLETTEPVDEAP